MQDLARDSTLDVLDSLLVDGLADSQEVLAGDFARQDIYRPLAARTPTRSSSSPTESGVSRRPETVADRLELLTQRLTAAATMTLANNVRQPPRLAELIERLLSADLYIGFDRDFDEDKPDEHPLQVVLYRDEDEQQQFLANALIALWEDCWEPHEILILSPRRASAASRATGAVADALARHDEDANGTPWGTVHAFKGLEAPVVVLAGVDGTTPQWEELRYIGATRATQRLVVLTSIDEVAERSTLPCQPSA